MHRDDVWRALVVRRRAARAREDWSRTSMSDLPPPPEKLIVIDAAVSGQSLPIPLNRSENRSDAPTHQPDGASQGSAPPVIWRWWLARAGALLGSFPSRVFLLAAACYLLLTGVHVVFLSQPMPSGFVGWASAFTSAWNSSDRFFPTYRALWLHRSGVGGLLPAVPWPCSAGSSDNRPALHAGGAARCLALLLGQLSLVLSAGSAGI